MFKNKEGNKNTKPNNRISPGELSYGGHFQEITNSPNFSNIHKQQMQENGISNHVTVVNIIRVPFLAV